MFGDKQFPNIGFPTPEDVPEESTCRQFSIPASSAWLALVMGCLYLLTEEDNWQRNEGGISRQDAAAAAQVIFDSGYLNLCPAGETEIPTPFWEDADETDDQASPEEQIWYGEVTDIDTAPSLTFFENAAVWTFTGILAVAGAPAAAIAFHTIAPKLVVAIRSDVGAVIRVWFDDIMQAEVTSDDAIDDVISVPVYGDPTLEGHDLYIVDVTP